MANAINIILEERNSPYVDFVEIETDDGKSINIGERLPYGNFTKIRITVKDIEEVINEST